MNDKNKKRRLSLLNIIEAAAAVVIIIIVVFFAGVLKDRSGVSLSEPVTVEIPSGTGAAAAADILHESGVIKHPFVFRLESKINGYDSSYQPGSITVTDGMSYEDILNEIVKTNRDTITVSIPEGYEAKQIAHTLNDAGVVPYDDVMAALDP